MSSTEPSLSYYLQHEVQIAQPEVQDPQVIQVHLPLPLNHFMPQPCASECFPLLLSNPSVVSRIAF